MAYKVEYEDLPIDTEDEKFLSRMTMIGEPFDGSLYTICFSASKPAALSRRTSRYKARASRSGSSSIQSSGSLIQRVATLGKFESLPTEIYQHILRNMDFQTLGAMRLTNSTTKNSIDSLQEYKNVKLYAPDVLRALSMTNTAVYYSAAHIYHLLRAEHCIVCGDYGSYFFLLRGCRCCYSCLYHDDRFRVKELTDARQHYGIKEREKDIRERFPVVDTIPGEYDSRNSEPIYCKQMKIVSNQHAMELGFGPPRKVEEEHKLPTLTYREPNPTHMYGCSGMTQGDPPFRGMAAVEFPYLNSATGKVERGTYCSGCYGEFQGISIYNELTQTVDDEFKARWLALRRVRERAFTEAGFHSHFESCVQGKAEWRMRVAGIKLGPNQPQFYPGARITFTRGGRWFSYSPR